MAKKIDEQVVIILNKALEKAEGLIRDNLDKFEELSMILFEKETILEKEFKKIMK